MLKMIDVHVIRHKVFNEKLSRSQVARELGVSRNTVSKYLEQAEPVRREAGPRPCPVLERVKSRIDELVLEWGRRTTGKQRLTGSRIFEQLREEGYEVGKTTVVSYFSQKQRKGREVFVPLIWSQGDGCQVDFFEVTVEINGQPQKVWKFLMRLMYSGRDFVWLYERCDQVSFLDGHVRAFAHFMGVPQRVIYDNLVLAVKKRVGVERELTDRFRALCSHYLFEPCFARPGEGHDKGGVESRGKAIRWQHLSPVPQGDSLAGIANELMASIERQAIRKLDAEGRSVMDRFGNEQLQLKALPRQPFEARQPVLVIVSSKATVQIQAALYSVPDRWARRDATAYVGVTDIRLVCGTETHVVEKVRPGARNIKYRDYLPTLARKPQAVRQVAPALLAELGEPFGQLWRLLEDSHGGLEAGRVFAKIIGVITDQGEGAVRAALEHALVQGRADLSHLQSLTGEPPRLATVPVPEVLQQYTIEAGRASDYDWLLTSGGVQ